GASLAAALAGGSEPTEFRPSFVDGAGSKSLLPAMWKRALPLLAGSYVVSLDETAAAVRLLAERARVVAEGAGALAVAAALKHGREGERLVCVVSGGNIDSARLGEILSGRTPV
ncbi:MAG: pyridoxal-phosphate dependent enzyme, partial [Actinobacteria bacterium]|nr:pyridoxal-phosphate dependent enzyme [Actinomycetota bacterium]